MTKTIRFEPMGIEVSEPELDTFAKINEALVQGQAAIEELALLKPILAFAISKLSNDKKQLKISLSDQARLGEWDVQMKQESKSGAIVFRVVKA